MTTNSVNPSYLIVNKINGYIEEGNGSKYSTLVPTNDESRDTLEKYKELWTKFIGFIRSITNILNN